MLTGLFTAPTRVQSLRCGPFGPQLEGFANYLCQRGYSKISARRHLRSAEHFVHWAVLNGLSEDQWGANATSGFDRHLSRCCCRGYGCADRTNILVGVRLFISAMLGVSSNTLTTDGSAEGKSPIFLDFCAWMREQRSTTEATLYNYSIPINSLIERCAGDPSALDASSLREFVLASSRGSGREAAKRCTTALRMFLRFLISNGICSASLLPAVPTVVCWRLESVPRILQPSDVDRLIASCNLSLPTGRRDRAILLLLARLGLRAGDIVQMRLQDIDWKEGWIRVRGKGQREVRLPLSNEVGQAIVAYLQDGRPPACCDAVFLRSRAPFQALASHCAVSVIVGRAILRAGVTRPGRGAAHLFRHSLASSMLKQGASLQDIAAVLRHRSVETTQIYAKVDVTALAQIAQPWMEVPSC